MSSLLADLRHAMRLIGKDRVFTLVAVLTLALGIGANTAIFSIANAVLFRPLPFRAPERLVMIWEHNPKMFSGEVSATPANFLAWRSESQKIEAERFNTSLLGLFALVALALAGVGIYGVISYSVSQATREIGIRRALGAQAGDILRLVIGRALLLATIGIALGAAGALALTRFIESLLFQVSPTDPLVFAAVASLFFTLAAAASYLPARRASRIDPLLALRYE